MSLRPSWKRNAAVPVLIALFAAVAVGLAAWFAVRGDVKRWSEGGFTVGPEMKFVFFFAGLAGGIVFLLSRRLLRGPKIVRMSWLLSVPGAQGEGPTVGDLVGRIEARGYRLSATQADVLGVATGEIARRTPLANVSLRIADARLGGPEAGVIVQIGAQTGIASVESLDTRGTACQELATYVIAELDALLPGVTYTQSGSTLSANAAADLRALLPSRPVALSAR
jgi:hypothetical protein